MEKPCIIGSVQGRETKALATVLIIYHGIHHYMPLDVEDAKSNKSVYLSIHNTSAVPLFMAYAVAVTELHSTKRVAHLDN